MAWTITAADYGKALPGTVAVTVTGDPDTAIEIYRVTGTGKGVPVRNTSGAVTTASGLFRVLDTEPPFGSVRYELRVPGQDVSGIYSNTVTVRMPASGRPILRSILSPFGTWAEVTVQDETSLDYRTSSTVYDVVSAFDPVVVSDVRRDRSGTFLFMARDMTEADVLLSMMRDGDPLLLRACPSPRLLRDTYFYPLDVREERWGMEGRRLIIVDYQSVAAVAGDAPLPPAGIWRYGDLALQTTAPTYGDLPVEWEDYLDLATRAVP